MTYCVGLMLNRGLVFMSDTRTNSGVDNISTYRKMYSWSTPGERVITLLTAGNLATTQAVISLLDERSKIPAERNPSLLEAPSMFQVASLVGETLREVIASTSPGDETADSSFAATIILGGQIAGGEPRLFLIYPEGNFIEASSDTRYFQSGETKYGRPILVRAIDPDMSFEEAVKLLMVSFDSTLKANLSVGMPLDLQIYQKDSFKPGPERRFEANDPYYQAISAGWGEALRNALGALPDF
nr:proteasome-type protease [Gammaproteobacteria bacterium]